METTVGQTIKGYEILEQIGDEGGMGTVFRAMQPSVGREVALKIIKPSFANQPDFIRRFENEAQLIARLEHINIVPLYDYWRDQSGAYLVMRYLKGGSVRRVLENEGTFPLLMTAELLDQICSALYKAHCNDIIHRDLKPANILLDEDGNTYLADFGIAKDLTQPDNNRTGEDTLLGTYAYMSPEQARKERLTAQSDLFSLGIILFELLTGRHPFAEFNYVERLFKNMSDPLPHVKNYLREIDSGVAEGINAIIQKATAKDPTQRYHDALEMAAAFREETSAGVSVVERLTRREHEILYHIVKGKSNKDIADELVIKRESVRDYIKKIYKKLHVHTRMQAIVRASDLKLFVPGVEEDGDLAAIDKVTYIPTEEFLPENPYKGLRAFQPADTRDFFGREKLTEKLLKRLSETSEMSRFLAVVGPSGSGKSSVVKAGLIPALWRGELPGSADWFVVDMLPGEYPLDELEIALSKVSGNQTDNLHEHLMRDERGLVRVAQLILPQDGSQLVVIIDQFEEIFTLVQDEAARSHFLDLLIAAVTDSRSRVRVVITLRADFYDRPLHYPHFGELVRSRMETVLPLSAEELEASIMKPAHRVGVSFEPGLVSAIVTEVKFQPGALPLLQYAMTELFERRQGRLLTRDIYQQIGGTAGALAKRADEIYGGLDEAGQEAVRQLFLRLVTLGEGVEDTRRRVLRSELIAIAEDADLMEDLINLFAEYRLLSLDHDPGTRSPTIEVAHEAILREWERLRGWLNESRDEIKLQRQLAIMATEWEKAYRDKSYLVSGSRLEQFEHWAAESALALTEQERTYLVAGIAERKRQQTLEEKRQQNELRLAHDAANAQRRAANRLRYVVGILLAASIFGILLTLQVFRQAQDVSDERDRAKLALVNEANAHATSEANEAYAQSLLHATSARLLSETDPTLALALAIEAVGGRQPPLFSQRTLAELAFSPGVLRTIRFVWGEKHFPVALMLNPDGMHWVVLYGDSEGDLETVVRDATTGTEILHFPGIGYFSQDNKSLLAFDRDGLYQKWDISSSTQIQASVRLPCIHIFMIPSPDREKVLCDGERELTLVDLNTASAAQLLIDSPGHGTAQGATFSQDGRFVLAIASASPIPGVLLQGNELHLWDVATGIHLRRFVGHTQRITDIAFSPDGSWALSASADQSLILWDMATGNETRRFTGHTDIVTSVDFTPNGHFAVSGSNDHSAILWEVATGQPVERYSANDEEIFWVSVSPDGKSVYLILSDSSIVEWDISNGMQASTLQNHTDRITTATFNATGTRVLSGSSGSDKRLILWNVATGQPIRDFPSETGAVSSVAFSPNSHYALSAAITDNALTLWNLETGEIECRLEGHTDWITSVTFSPDGKTALSASLDTTLILWDIETGSILRRFEGHTDRVNSVVFSPDGQSVASGGLDNTVIIWDVATANILHRLEGHTDRVNSVAFSQDGQKLISGSGDQSLVLWEVATGRQLLRFTGHTDAVLSVAFSPNGMMILSGGREGAVILWDISGAELRRFVGHTDAVNSVAFSPDGRMALTASNDQTLRLWHVHSIEELVQWTLQNRVVKQLTCEDRALYLVEPLCLSAPTE